MATETNEQKMARLEKENEALKTSLASASSPKTLKFKVSGKGGVSVYGLGRFPVTLYREQWASLTEAMPRLQEFIKANITSLKSKSDAIVDKAAA